MDVGLHHHRMQRLVDPAARLEDTGEERALAQLRDRQLDVAGLGRQRPRPRAVAFGAASLGALIPAGADHLRRLQLDHLLQGDLDRLPDQVHAFPGAEHLQQFDRADWDKAIGEISFGAYLAVHTKNLADGPTYLEATPLPPNPTTPRDSYRGSAGGACSDPTDGRRTARRPQPGASPTRSTPRPSRSPRCATSPGTWSRRTGDLTGTRPIRQCHRNVIGNDRQRLQDNPIQLMASDEDSSHQLEVSPADSSCLSSSGMSPASV